MKLEEVNRRTKEAVDFLVAALESGHSEVLTTYLGAMAKFHTYSFGNIMLIARQKPDATNVAGLRAWNSLARKPPPQQRAESRPTQPDAPRLSRSLPPKIVNDSVVLLDWIQKNHNAYIQSYPSFATIRPYLTILQQDGFIKESDVSNMDGTVFELTSLGQKSLIAAGVPLV
jgi:hypothetical protein